MTLSPLQTIEINGRTYQEAERGKFDAILLDNGEEIAGTYDDSVILYSGLLEDIKLWAESFDLHKVIDKNFETLWEEEEN